jgi:hypothetical protein
MGTSGCQRTHPRNFKARNCIGLDFGFQMLKKDVGILLPKKSSPVLGFEKEIGKISFLFLTKVKHRFEIGGFMSSELQKGERSETRLIRLQRLSLQLNNRWIGHSSCTELHTFSSNRWWSISNENKITPNLNFHSIHWQWPIIAGLQLRICY